MSSKTSIMIAGDLFPMPCNYSEFKAGDAKALFGEKLCGMFAGADIRVCNLEGCFTDADTPTEKAGPNIKAPVGCVNAVRALGINYATLGNTHSMDFGRQGYLDTCKALDEAGISYFGWGDDKDHIRSYVSVTHGDRRIILYNTTERFENAPADDHPGVNLYDEYRICEEISELKKQCDNIIVFYHGGIEGTQYNSQVMRQRFHRMADSGADVVISQHTHAVGEQEHYNGAYLLYGQGNFCFHLRSEVTPLLAEGLVLELELSDEGVKATPHRILRTELGCIYDEDQKLDDFYERSRLHDALLSGDKNALRIFDEGFGKGCANWAATMFYGMRGKNEQDDVKRKELPPAELREYLSSQFTRTQLLVIQMFLRNEEFNEVGNRIISDLLNQ